MTHSFRGEFIVLVYRQQSYAGEGPMQKNSIDQITGQDPLFARSVKNTIKSLLPDGYPDINRVAEEHGQVEIVADASR